MRNHFITCVLLLMAGLLLEASGTALADVPQGPRVVSIFLKLDGIAGSSTDEKHPNEIQLISFNWSESNKEKAKPEPHDALVLKAIDATTPKLAEALATGKVIATATVTVRVYAPARPTDKKSEPGGPVFGSAVDQVQYVFTDVQLTAVSHTVIQRAEEQVQFKYGKLVIRYLSADGKPIEAPATKSE
ncbi:MAG TPA: type VI secretion system tube protein Hcp [Tepidisphaeraceae bacterium]|nr:type VI secretion system tube protein Hcp [Tepidisphaeraceae bacterium]